jgi:hypothetical protein
MAAAVRRSNGLSSLPADHFRIEFEDDVLPAPVSRLSESVADDEEEDFDARLRQTQEELLQLKHQARLVERRKEELEERNRKERDFAKGRTEMHEKLTRVLVTLEREAADTQHRLDVFLHARQLLARHYRAVSELRAEGWERTERSEHLDHALAIITDARLDFEKTMTQVEALFPLNSARSAAESSRAAAVTLLPRDFRYWLRAGFAFTLPLIALGLAALVVHAVW